ncbi:hypothetical protein J6590_067186 [Homalodisca vitripennis]|nr:hypothetical protein J6590_067186 [Homalodisca vitripennis]
MSTSKVYLQYDSSEPPPTAEMRRIGEFEILKKRHPIVGCIQESNWMNSPGQSSRIHNQPTPEYIDDGETCGTMHLVCLGKMGTMKGTPTAAMDLVLNLPPLDIFVIGDASMVAYRLQYNENWHHDHASKLSKILKVVTLEIMSDSFAATKAKPFTLTRIAGLLYRAWLFITVSQRQCGNAIRS